jgi:hypothetical protein
VQGTLAPGEVLARVNALLAAEIPAGMFVTCFYALLEPGTNRPIASTAGVLPNSGRRVCRWG